VQQCWWSYTTFLPTLAIKEIKRTNWMREWTKLIMHAAMQLWCTCISIVLRVSLTFKFLVNIFLTCWIRKSIDFWIRVTQLLLAGNATWLHPISLKIECGFILLVWKLSDAFTNFTRSLWSHSLYCYMWPSHTSSYTVNRDFLINSFTSPSRVKHGCLCIIFWMGRICLGFGSKNRSMASPIFIRG